MAKEPGWFSCIDVSCNSGLQVYRKWHFKSENYLLGVFAVMGILVKKSSTKSSESKLPKRQSFLEKTQKRQKEIN